MEKFLIIISFIPWILCYLKYSLNTIVEVNNRIITFDWFKKSIFKIFRFETLFLFLIFLYFAKYRDNLVCIMLFAVITLYLFISSFHDNRDPKRKSKIKNLNIFVMVFTIIVAIIPLIFYFKTHKLITTYFVLFAILFFSRFIVLIANTIYNSVPSIRGGHR